MRLRDDEPDIPAQINVVPMIDVIFAILTFFIMSSLSLSSFEGIPVNLPQAATGQQTSPGLEVLITLRANGELFLNKTPITLETLRAKVQERQGQNPAILVVLNADQSVPHGTVVTVMDQLRQIKGAKLAIATQPQ
jgi:biopolymer transport protein ExbD